MVVCDCNRAAVHRPRLCEEFVLGIIAIFLAFGAEIIGHEVGAVGPVPAAQPVFDQPQPRAKADEARIGAHAIEQAIAPAAQRRAWS